MGIIYYNHTFTGSRIIDGFHPRRAGKIVNFNVGKLALRRSVGVSAGAIIEESPGHKGEQNQNYDDE
jgi:hypothetical protein